MRNQLSPEPKEMPPYYDIFISHAWAFGRRHNPEQPLGWVLAFKDLLIREIRKLYFPYLEIFLDDTEIVTGSISEKVQVALSRTLNLVCLISDEYRLSVCCTQERSTMRKLPSTHPARVAGRHPDCIIPVYLEPFRTPGRADPLKDLKHVDFYRRDRDDPQVFETLPLDEGGEAGAAIRRVAKMIADNLFKIRGPSGPLEGASGRIYVSFTSDIIDEYDCLSTRLARNGYELRPADELPSAQPAFDDIVLENLTASELSIHAFGSNYRIPDDPLVPPIRTLELSTVHLQSNVNARRLLWTPEKKNILDEMYRAAISAANPFGVRNLEYDLTYDQFVERTENFVRETHRVLSWQPALEDETPPGCRNRIFVPRAPHDAGNPDYLALLQWLASRPDVHVWRAADNLEYLYERNRTEYILSQCTLVLFFCSTRFENWAESTYKDFRKRGDAALKRAIYCASAPVRLAPLDAIRIMDEKPLNTTLIEQSLAGLI